MEPNYGATDDEANTPLMEDSPLLTEKPRREAAPSPSPPSLEPR